MTCNCKIVLDEGAQAPVYKHPTDAGCDVRSIENKVIPAHGREIVDTGIHIQPDSGFWAGVYPRSGLTAKYGITIANCVGVIDPDYRGSINVVLLNTSDNDFQVNKGDRIAQLIFLPRYTANFEQVLFLDDTERGDGGFGSTGTK